MVKTSFVKGEWKVETGIKENKQKTHLIEKKLVEIKGLKKYFRIGKYIVKAVDDVTFHINQCETLGLVGESGCGKSTVGRTIMRLYKATGGEILFDGEDLQTMSRKKLKSTRRDIQMIFQDPYSSLDPNMTVKEIINEPLELNGLAKGKKRITRIKELLQVVGLNPDHMNRYPHEFSGGQCQRIGIARALAVEPKFIICDEPISALDVSIQAQVVNLLKDLQNKFGLTYLFIAHDLSMVNHISNRVAVMYLGQMVELAGSNELYNAPLHPYTKALYSSIPIPDPKLARSKERVLLKGDLPSPMNPPSGCHFRTRCPKAMDVCERIKPSLKEIKPDHFVACHLYDEE